MVRSELLIPLTWAPKSSLRDNDPDVDALINDVSRQLASDEMANRISRLP